MFSFVHCNRRSLQCLPHRNVRIAREWNALSIGNAPGSPAGMSLTNLNLASLFFFVHIHIFTFSSNPTSVCTVGLQNENRLFNKQAAKILALRGMRRVSLALD